MKPDPWDPADSYFRILSGLPQALPSGIILELLYFCFSYFCPFRLHSDSPDPFPAKKACFFIVAYAFCIFNMADSERLYSVNVLVAFHGVCRPAASYFLQASKKADPAANTADTARPP